MSGRAGWRGGGRQQRGSEWSITATVRWLSTKPASTTARFTSRVHPPPPAGTGATTAALDAEAGGEEERGHTQASLKDDNMDIFTLAFRAYFEPNAPATDCLNDGA